MSIKNSVNKFYFDMCLSELRIMNRTSDYPRDLSYNSLLYLDIIAYKESCTASWLADALNISKPAVTAKLNELEASGYIQKMRSEQDKRVFYISLSEQMRSVYDGYDRHTDAASLHVLEKYTPQQLELFCSILDEVSTSYLEETSK